MITPWHVPAPPQRRREYACYRAPGAASIDGNLDKPFWREAPWTELFVDIEGDPPHRPAPRHATRAKLVWDDDHLYIAAQLDEPHVWATLTQRDSVIYHDNDFEVFLSPTGDNHTYYELEINALGTIFDLFLAKPYRDGGPADHAWDVAGLKAAVKIDGTLNDPRDTDRGWSVELAFPWRAFDRHGGTRCPPRDGDHWRLNFSRVQWDHEVIDGRYRKIEGRPEHNWVWSPQGVIDMHRPEMWGFLQFSSITAGRGTAPFVPDPVLPVHDWLQSVYQAQRSFHQSSGKWAEQLADLGDLPSCPTIREATIEMTTDAWRCIATETITGRQRQWGIEGDSRLWMK
jgi:hypothetical protein